MTAYRPYLPLNTLKPFSENIWIADGPEIQMRFCGAQLPFPTRMTVVRLPGRAIWIHSPIMWSVQLHEMISDLGDVRFLVAPNNLHYWYLPDWQQKFPEARSYGPPRLARRARQPVRIDEGLGPLAPAGWAATIDQCCVPGSLLTEFDFFHRPSRSLILTDLIENFEPSRVRNPWLRWVIRLSGAADPDGKAPYDMQLSFMGHRRELRAEVKRMIDWAPERIIIAHGRCYTENGTNELKRAFRWVL